MSEHDRELSQAFDQQAERFERAPVQTHAGALAHLVEFAGLPAGARVLDCGCGPGLVAEALLDAGLIVTGIDLSAEMVARARARCARFGDRARFEQGSVFGVDAGGGFDAAVSRYVLHHVEDPRAFVQRQLELVRPGGLVVASDHTTDGDPARAAWHTRWERARDRTHTRNLTPGELLELFAQAGLTDLTFVEEAFELDFDEWFDRGTPGATKDTVRAGLLAGAARGFTARERKDGGISIACWRGLVKGARAAAVPGVAPPP